MSEADPDSSRPILSTSTSEPAISSQLVPHSPSDSTDGVYRLRSVSSVELEDQLGSLLEDQELSPLPSEKKRLYYTPKSESTVDFKGDSGIDPGMCFHGTHELYNHTPVNASAAAYGMTTPTCSSQHARQISDSSEYSFILPTPSYAWAPPPSPVLLLHPSPISSPSCLREGSTNGYSSPDTSPVLKQRTLSGSTPFGFSDGLIPSSVRDKEEMADILCSKSVEGVSGKGLCDRKPSCSLDSGLVLLSGVMETPVGDGSGSKWSCDYGVRKLSHYRTVSSPPKLTSL